MEKTRGQHQPFRRDLTPDIENAGQEPGDKKTTTEIGDNPEDRLNMQIDLNKAAEKAQLTKKEQDLLRRYFEGQTYKEIGEYYFVTANRAKQNVKKVLAKIKEELGGEFSE